MVAYIKSDLEFILEQIKISEQHAAGTPLYGPGGLIPAYTISAGLRTVDGRDNNLLPGQESWGAADTQFPALLDPQFRPADGTLFDPDGPGPAPAMPTSANYNPSNNPNSLVFDSSLRTISNLIVDQTLGNPAAILKGLQIGGVAPADMATVGLVQAIYNIFKPFADAEYQARVVAQNHHATANALSDGDPLTPPSAAEQAALDVAAASDAAHALTVDAMDAARVTRDLALEPFGIEMDGDNVHIGNVAPDAGLSAPFNSWFTLFGQFFDHGLDLVNKGGSGTVFVPLTPDDPLYVEGSHTNFMVLTRATILPGADNVMGTADDITPVNTTTAFVDQNQTYTSHSSHQVFLRQYELNAAGEPVATGKLIEGGGASPGGMATWGEVKAQALLLGIQLTDLDVGNVPLLRTDQYGNFIPGPGGFAQVITGVGADGIPNTADDIVVSGTPGVPVNPTTVGALRIGHAFLADIAHDAVPNGLADGDIEIGLANPGNGLAVYDNELLDAHFIAGDGRVNENIGLTAVHHVFHSEHNRLVEHTKDIVISDAATMLAGGATQAAAVAFLNEWLATDVATVPLGAAAIDALVWDGERLFQAAKFGTEMQYQHLVFEDFARKIQPNIDFFVVPDGYHADINPSIVAEFAHVVYRFGHSMLTETIDRLDPSFNPDQIGLIQAFLNPIEFDTGHTIADGVAAGDIIRGMTRQVGNEIDEFVTSALRNNLLGLPLDLATINLARGRDTGVPSLNEARREFYDASSHAPELKPYDSWVEFAGNLKNEASVINFIAAYGLHPLITAETTIEGKRAAAMAIIFDAPQNIVDDPNTPANEARTIAVPADALDFLNGTGAWASLANGVTTTGLDKIDLWIGGLAEKILPFGGMLGSTFNFVFEVQLEKLQDGDRFYYLQRLDGLHLLSEMENNTFAKLISLNADAGHLPSDVFSTPGLILEVDRTKQYNPGLGETAGADGILADNPLTLVNESADNLGNDPAGGSILTPLVIRNNPGTAGPDSNYLRYTGTEHVLLGGTAGNDIIIASEGDDTLYGDAGNDRLEGGAGNDSYIGGDGDDIITDLGGDDIIRSGRGNDVINAGVGVDLIVGDEGQDFIVLGSDMLDEAFGGVGNDFVLGSKTTEQTVGGEGDDWIEVGAWTGAVGDNFDDQFARDAVWGHDVFHGDGGFDEFIGEGGDDIWVGSLGRGKFDGMSGFDWTTYSDMQFGVDADLNRLAFDANPLPPPNAALDTFSFVEGVSGSTHDDIIIGTDITAADMPTEGFRGSVLNAEGIALINGLQAVVGAGVTSFDGGNILLGGDGSDTIDGRGGDDIIDGDKWLNVRISVRENIGPNGGVGAEIDSAQSMTELVTEMFNGTYNPGQLQIVREILTADGTNDIDVAVFSGNLADYTVTRPGGGAVRVVDNRGIDSSATGDLLYHMELARFADGDLFIGNNTPAGELRITGTENVLTADRSGVTDGDGLPPAAGFTYRWQSSPDGLGGWANIAGATNQSYTVPAGNLAFHRVVMSYVDNGGFAETITSVMSARVGNNAGAAVNDTLAGTAVANLLNGRGGNDILNGLAGNDILNGGAGIDTLNGGDDDDTLNGGAGNDTLIGGLGADLMDGGADTDTADYTASDAAVNINRQTDTYAGGHAEGDVLNSIENVIGSAFNDTLVGNDSANALSGLGGDDRLVGGVGADVLDGGIGIDTADYTASNAAVNINRLTNTASGGHAAGDTLNGIEDVIGSAFNDTLVGNTLANMLSGLAGNDNINGGDGNDTLIGGVGNDVLNGAAGVDTTDYSASNAAVNVNLLTNTASGGHAAGDTLSNLENVIGSAFADTLVGSAVANTLNGLAGNDSINGGAGNDIINGGANVDLITQLSTDGRDLVDGGSEVDTFQLNGVATAETFRIYTRAAFAAVAGNTLVGIAAGTEIIITRNGTNAGSIIAELDNIEEIRVNVQQVTSPGGTPPGGSTTNTGDNIQVIGDFTGTSLNFNTITIDGNSGDDTVDITSLNSAHRIVFKSNGGNDTIIGTLRPQDVIELPNGETIDDYVQSTANGVTTMTNGNHSISYVSTGAGPQIGNGDDDDNDDDDDDDDDTSSGGDDTPCGGSDDDDDDETTSTAGAVRTGTPQSDVLNGTAAADNIIAFAGDDVAIGNAGDDAISAGDGADFVNGGDGRDVIFAGAGDDQIFGGAQADVIYGDAGADRIFGDQGNDLINAGAGDDTVFGGAGNDLIVAEQGDGNDTYFGDDSDGGAGKDTLDMSAVTADVTANLGVGPLANGSATSTQTGSDTLWGIENINTGSGNDTITASNVANMMNGGAGNDTFKFLTSTGADGDTIVGFEPGDHLDLSGIDANTGAAGDQGFSLLPSGAFTAAGQLAVTFGSRSDGGITAVFTVVEGNIDGDLDADFKFEIEGHHNLNNSNFNL